LFNEIDVSKASKIFLIGKHMKYLYEKYADKNNFVFCNTLEDLEKEIKKIVYSEKGLVLLFKASNEIGLYKVVKSLVETL
jgi:UDP-N-acetylmuramyl pentapeptide synthase